MLLMHRPLVLRTLSSFNIISIIAVCFILYNVWGFTEGFRPAQFVLPGAKNPSSMTDTSDEKPGQPVLKYVASTPSYSPPFTSSTSETASSDAETTSATRLAEGILVVETGKPSAGRESTAQQPTQPAHSIPTSTSSKIPKKIWYKLGPKGMSDEIRGWTDSCIRANPEYRAEFMTDESGEAWVRDTFGATRPDIVEGYSGLSVPILKADFLRYLLLWAEGGIWSDLDVSCEPGVPIDSWVPVQYKAHAGLVVGWEFDSGWGDNFIRQFASWTIMAQPQLNHMLQVCDDILASIHDKVREHNVTGVADLTLPMVGDVVDFTGPRRLTRSVFASLEKNMTVDNESIKLLEEPKLIGDVLIMPGFSFASSSNKYNETQKVGPALVTHHYAGSWKNDRGGEMAKRSFASPAPAQEVSVELA